MSLGNSLGLYWFVDSDNLVFHKEEQIAKDLLWLKKGESKDTKQFVKRSLEDREEREDISSAEMQKKIYIILIVLSAICWATNIIHDSVISHYKK